MMDEPEYIDIQFTPPIPWSELSEEQKDAFCEWACSFLQDDPPEANP